METFTKTTSETRTETKVTVRVEFDWDQFKRDLLWLAAAGALAGAAYLAFQYLR